MVNSQQRIAFNSGFKYVQQLVEIRYQFYWYCRQSAKKLQRTYENLQLSDVNKADYEKILTQGNAGNYDTLQTQDNSNQNYETLQTQDSNNREYEKLQTQDSNNQNYETLQIQDSNIREYEKLQTQDSNNQNYEALQTQDTNNRDYETLQIQDSNNREYETLRQKDISREETIELLTDLNREDNTTGDCSDAANSQDETRDGEWVKTVKVLLRLLASSFLPLQVNAV